MEDDIEFEDLGGSRDEDHADVEVDLDAENSGITRKPRIPQPGADADDDPDFDDLPSNRRDEPPPKSRGDEGKGGDDKANTNAFQARLDRERRAKRRERERAEAAERRAQQLEARLKKAARQGGDEEVKALESQIATVEANLEQALEGGNSKEQVRLTSQLTDLKAKRIAADYTRAAEADIDDDDAGDGRSPPKNPLVDEFLEPHSDWYQRKGFERYTRMLNRLDKEVFDEGFDPKDEDYYEELNSRLKKKAPELFDESGEVDVDGAEERRKAAAEVNNRDKRERASVVGAGDGGVDSSPANKPVGNRVQLTAEDFRTMRKFGLDTNDKEVLKEFARNKRQRMQEEANA